LKGERTCKPFEDLLVAAQHGRITKEMGLDETGPTVVLIDEIDMLFEGDKPFISGLCTYLHKAPSRHVVVTTSNMPLKQLMCFYAFPLDMLVHELKGRRKMPLDNRSCEFADLELASVMASFQRKPKLRFSPSELLTCVNDWTCARPPRENFRSHEAVHAFLAYASRSLAHKGAMHSSMEDWLTLGLPTWSLLESAQREAEEVRQMTRRRRAGSQHSTTQTYLRGGLSKEVLEIVVDWPYH